MTVQYCQLTDTRNPIDKPKWLWVWPTQDFTDSDGVGWSSQARSTFNYTNNSLGSDAKVPRKDADGNVVLWKLRRIMGSGTKSWPDDLSDPTAGVALDATTAALDDIAPVPGTPHFAVPIVTRALLNGVEIDPDAEGVLNLGNLSTSTALSTETARATAAETANAAAISTETTRATNAEALKAPLASPALTGTPTAPTQTAGNSSTRLATTAYADAAVATQHTTDNTSYGPVVGSDNWLKAWASNPDNLIRATTITRDANEAATSAGVVWPDGSPGTYTATTVSSAFPGSVDAYTVTYGSPVTKTVTQPAVTRDANGAVTNRPALTVS